MPELFEFTLSADDTRRNTELLSSPLGYNKVVFGGIVLDIESIVPARTSFRIDQNSWMKKVDLGIPNSQSVKYRTNKDGTKSKITTTVTTFLNGNKRTVTEELIYPVAPKTTAESETLKIPVVDPSSDLTLDGTPKALWLDKAIQKNTTTLTVPAGQEVGITTTETIINPEDPKNRRIVTEKQVDEQKPIRKPKPVEFTTITGKKYDQFISPYPPQGIDTEWWNDEMFVTRSEDETNTERNNDGTETVTRYQSFQDADGLLKTIVTVETKDLEPEDETNTVVSKSVKQPGSKEVTETLYNKDGTEVSSKVTVTLAYDSITGESAQRVTEVTVTETNEFGKILEKRSVATFDPITEVEEVVETETVLDAGDPVITYSRDISRDLNTGIETLSETITEVDGLGVEQSRTRTETSTVSTTLTEIEEERADVEDEIIDDIVEGFIISEYEMSGELLPINQVFKIREKFQQHISAWAFIAMAKAKLEKGDNLSPAKRQQLYRELQKVYLGDPGELVRGGPVLDRIRLYAWGEVDLPAVFSPNDGFTATPIPGTWGLFNWTMRLQVIQGVERKKDNSYRQEVAGGVYGRSESDHWLGDGMTSDFVQEVADLKDVSDGGQWPYN